MLLFNIKKAILIASIFHFSQASLAFDSKEDEKRFFSAVQRGDLATITNPNLRLTISDLNARHLGYTPLMMASFYNHSNVVEWLIQNGADIDAVPSDENPEETALALAYYDRGQDSPYATTSSAIVLLAYGANPNINSERLERIRTKNPHALLFLNAAKSEQNKFKRLGKLRAVNLDVNLPESPTWAPIFQRAEQWLQGQHHASPVHPVVLTPLDMPFPAGSQISMRALMNLGIMGEDTRRVVLLSALMKGDLETIREMSLTTADLAEKLDGCNTALMVAAYCNHDHLVEWLIREGADIDARNANGQSALALSLSNPLYKSITLSAAVLLAYGADASFIAVREENILRIFMLAIGEPDKVTRSWKLLGAFRELNIDTKHANGSTLWLANRDGFVGEHSRKVTNNNSNNNSNNSNNNNNAHYKISSKYLEGGVVPSAPILTVNEREHQWLDRPSYALRILREKQASFSAKTQRGSTHTFDQPLFKVRFVSLNNLARRMTFVFPGRMEDARVPREDGKSGRVVLVVPSKDESVARTWLDSDTDLLIIDGLQTSSSLIDYHDLGLVTSRRLAVLYFAHHLQLDDFMMLDDNIDKFYLGDEKIGTWSDIYNFLSQSAERSGVNLLSVRAYDPINDKNGPLAHKDFSIHKGTMGSKVFFFNSKEIFKAMSTPKDVAALLPSNMKAWGEDVWMHFALQEGGSAFGVVPRDAALFKRVPWGPKANACVSVIDKADAWVSAKYEEQYANADDRSKAVFDRMRGLVKANLEENQAEREKNSKLDLGLISIKSRNVKAKESDMLPKQDFAASLEPEKKRKRNEPKSTVIKIKLKSDKRAKLSFHGALTESVGSLLSKIPSDREILFPHQIDLIRNTAKASKGYVVMPTGTGKTNAFLTMAAAAQSNPSFAKHNIAIVVPTIDLVHKTYENIEDWNKLFDGIAHIDMKKVISVNSKSTTAGLLDLNMNFKNGGNIAIFCEDSFKNYLNLNPENIDLFSMFLIDELHKSSDDVLNCLRHYANQKDALLYGFSATPGETKTRYFGDEIFNYKFENALADGFLAPYLIDSLGPHFDAQALDAFIQTAGQYLKEKAHPEGPRLSEMKGVIWVPSIKKANELGEVLTKAEINVGVVHSKSPKSDVYIEEFAKANPRIKLLIAVDMLKLGFDATVNYAIFAKKILNTDDFSQMLGRALRGGPRFDTNEMEVETIKAPEHKIAYVLGFDDALPKNTAKYVQGEKKMIFAPDYFAQKEGGPSLEEDDNASEFGLAMEEEANTQQAYLNSIYDINKLDMGNGQLIDVRVRPVPADGDCGLHALNITRERFIAEVLKRWQRLKHNDEFARLMAQAFEEIGVGNIHAWAREFARQTDNGHAVHWMDITHLKILSWIFNFAINIYTVNGFAGIEGANNFIPLDSHEVVIDMSPDFTQPHAQFHLLWSAVTPDGPTVHFSELLLGQEAQIEEPSLLGLQNMFEEDQELGPIFNSQTYMQNVEDMIFNGPLFRKNWLSSALGL